MTQTGNVFEAKNGFRFEAMFGIAYWKIEGYAPFFDSRTCFENLELFLSQGLRSWCSNFICIIPAKANCPKRIWWFTASCGVQFIASAQNSFCTRRCQEWFWLGCLLNSEQPHLKVCNLGGTPIGLQNWTSFWSLERHPSNSRSSLHVRANS